MLKPDENTLRVFRQEARDFRESAPFSSVRHLLASPNSENLSRNYLIRDSGFIVTAIHSGGLELMTGEIARGISGSDHSFYEFKSLLPPEESRELHVTSTKFDCPILESLLETHSKVVSIHGSIDRNLNMVFVGGRDLDLRDLIISNLRKEGFYSNKDFIHQGRSKNNICNRGQCGAGVQLEISSGLRSVLSVDNCKLQRLCKAIRESLVN